MMEQVKGADPLACVENMSRVYCPSCKRSNSHLFHSRRRREDRGQLGRAFLGAIPLDPANRGLRRWGQPLVLRIPTRAAVVPV